MDADLSVVTFIRRNLHRITLFLAVGRTRACDGRMSGGRACVGRDCHGRPLAPSVTTVGADMGTST